MVTLPMDYNSFLQQDQGSVIDTDLPEVILEHVATGNRIAVYTDNYSIYGYYSDDSHCVFLGGLISGNSNNTILEMTYRVD